MNIYAFLLFLSLILCQSVLAVVIKDCPERVGLTLADIVVRASSQSSWGFVQAQKKLAREKSLSVDLVLNSAGKNKCYYTGTDGDGGYASAVLRGSTKPHAAKPAEFVSYTNSGSIVAHIPLARVEETGLTLKNFDGGVRVSYIGQHCSLGECILQDRYLADANTVFFH